MVTPPWLAVALAAISVLPGSVQAKDFCPGQCSDAGPDTSKWSVYPNFNLIKRCKETVFYSFNLYDSVDDRDSNHLISACTSFGCGSLYHRHNEFHERISSFGLCRASCAGL